MAEVDYLTILIPSIIAAAISFVLLGVKKLGATSEGTLTGTIRLEHVSAGMKELEERINKNFDRIENLITQREAESKESLASLHEKFEKINSEVRLHTWRLDKLEHATSSNKGAV